MKEKSIKRWIFVALLFMSGKVVEVTPFFFQDIAYFVLSLFFHFLDFLKLSRSNLEIYAFVLSNYIENLWLPILFLFPLFVLIMPIVVALATKTRRLVKAYWIFSTLVDLLLFVKFSISCDPGFLVAICAWGLIFGVGLVIFAFILRSIGLLLSFLLIRKKRTKFLTK